MLQDAKPDTYCFRATAHLVRETRDSNFVFQVFFGGWTHQSTVRKSICVVVVVFFSSRDLADGGPSAMDLEGKNRNSAKMTLPREISRHLF